MDALEVGIDDIPTEGKKHVYIFAITIIIKIILLNFNPTAIFSDLICSYSLRCTLINVIGIISESFNRMGWQLIL